MTERSIIGQVAYTENFPNGTAINVKNLDVLPDVNTTDTQDHEAWHVVAFDGHIVMATDVPGEGYLGLTITEGYSPIAAAGPHAMGCSGTDFDMSKPGAYSAVSAARAKLSNMHEEKQEVASAIKHKRTIGKSEALASIERARNRKLGKIPVEVTVTDSKGRTHVETLFTKKGVIKLEKSTLKIISEDRSQEQLQKTA